MKRNVFNLMISASLLLGLGSCGSDQLAPEQENPTPVVPTPDENGLVTLRFGVSNAGYGDGVPESRGAEAPVTFTQELGDGYVLESTLTSSPRTKAAGDPLREGTTVMIFTLDEDNKATGYQLQEMGADGVLNISVPAGVTPKLMLFTMGNEMVFRTDNGQMQQILSNTSEITNTAVGQYNAFSSAVELRDGSLAPLINIYNDNRLVDEGMIAIAGPIDTDNLAAMDPRISFDHVFCQLTWNITVDASVPETIGLVRAGFYPRTETGQMRFKSYVNGDIGLSELYVPTDRYNSGGGNGQPGTPGGGGYFNEIRSYTPPRDNTFITPANWSPNAEFSQSVCFQKPSPLAWGSGYPAMKIAIDSLTINNPSGNVTYQDQEITLTGPDNFVNGKEYTVNSRITKRLTWATSNIYWDGTKLTFDADAVNGGGVVAGRVPSATTDSSPYYQGVYFKWGSLVGIAPVGPVTNPSAGYISIFDDRTHVYLPTTNEAGYNSSYEDGHIESGLFTDIPAPPFSVLPAYGSFTGRTMKDAGTGIWYGDICAYITNGIWHMPTSKEVFGGSSDTDFLSPTVPTGEGWWEPNPTGWTLVSPPDDATSWAGRFVFTLTNNVLKHKNKWGQTVTFVPAGVRTTAGVTHAENQEYTAGQSGWYTLSTSPSLMDFAMEEVMLRSVPDRNQAKPVRCVK
ncbi:MAG: hypothetical protein LBN29_07880 [Mediterranea sp.]|jgi:hypothetical protein|nr:hypothetical protein [Mediterranea sp.]